MKSLFLALLFLIGGLAGGYYLAGSPNSAPAAALERVKQQALQSVASQLTDNVRNQLLIARPTQADANQLSYRNVTVYPDRFQCEVGGRDVELTPVEFRMLHALISRPGHVFSRYRLMELSYTDSRIVSDRTIDTHVKNLRKKLQRTPGEDELLHSIYGVGYKFE